MSPAPDNTAAAPGFSAAAPPVPPMPAHAVPVQPTPAPGRHTRTGGSIFLGVVLVVLGFALLAAQFIPVIEPWNAWPLVVVVVGLVQMFTPDHHGQWGLDRLMDGLGTAVIGAVLLGNTTGVVPWTMWLTFISLWPVLLIAAGVGLVGKASGQSWIRALSPLIIWGVLAYSVAAALGVAPALALFIQ